MEEADNDSAAPSAAHADVVIVGGGPAGLTAAIYLARFRRSVLLVDANQSRISKIPQSHNYPGFVDGIAGSTLLEALRKQLRQYPVRSILSTAEGVLHGPDGFTVRWKGGSARGKCLLLATGVTDIPPSMPHVLEALRAGALRYCPVCDGYEVIDRAVGVYADGAHGVGEAIYLRHFTADLVLFMDGGARMLSVEERLRLSRAGIVWAEEPVRSIRHWNGQVTVVHGER
ncbi:MAG: NAD(P)/FAD-dependent oxidoreductase, partial [Comamonadaceae bacterium]